MKIKKELKTLKEKFDALNEKPHELTDEELEKVSGGNAFRQSEQP